MPDATTTVSISWPAGASRVSTGVSSAVASDLGTSPSATAASASGASATNSGVYPALSGGRAASATLSVSGETRPVLAASGPASPITAKARGPSTGCQQENLCSYVWPDRDGSSVRHLSVARGQRAAN